MFSIHLAISSGEIKIDVLGYERPPARDADDANWLVTDVAVKTGLFSEKARASLRTEDFSNFKDELESALSVMEGTATFNTLEGAIGFTVEVKKTGQAQVRGELRGNEGPDASLSFSFESDQTHLVPLLEQLDTVTNEFPVRT